MSSVQDLVYEDHYGSKIRIKRMNRELWGIVKLIKLENHKGSFCLELFPPVPTLEAAERILRFEAARRGWIRKDPVE